LRRWYPARHGDGVHDGVRAGGGLLCRGLARGAQGPGVSGEGAAPVEPRTLVLGCHGPSCSERGSAETCRQLREAIAGSGARRVVRVSETGCLDSCATGPNVLVANEGAVQTGVKGESIAGLLALLTGTAVGRD